MLWLIFKELLDSKLLKIIGVTKRVYFLVYQNDFSHQ
jgi:hypothetical protein